MDKDMMIRYADVQLHRKELVGLKHVDFELPYGEFVYLLGRVGSGESSFLKSLYAEVPVYSGEAKIFDYDLTSIRRKQIPYLRRKIGIVFQDFRLLTDRNVYQNLSFVLSATGWKDKNDIDGRIETVLKEVGMLNKSYKMPHELSGGEQQRIVIARALLNSPELILADEPTGNLDPATGEQIVALLQNITASKGTSVIMATHNMMLVQQFPAKTYICENKRMKAEDSTVSHKE